MSEQGPYRLPGEPNPYAPPGADLSGLPGASMESAAGWVEPFSVGNVVERGWRIFKARMGNTLLIVIGAGVINFLGSLVVQFLPQGLQQARMNGAVMALAMLALLLANYALQFWIMAGQTIAILRLARDREAPFELVFSGARYFWRMIGATLLYLFATLPFLLIFGVAFGLGFGLSRSANDDRLLFAGVIVGALIAVPGLIIVALRLAQFPFVLVDRDCGVMDSLRGSWELTRGRVVQLFFLGIVVALIAMSGVLACGVGLLFTGPLGTLLTGCTYVCLSAGGTGGKVTEKDLAGEPERLDFLD
jgi:hypothetical protein